MYNEGNREIRTVKTVTAVLPFAEWTELKALARKHHVPVKDYVRAIIVDALAEEQALVQRQRTTGCTEQGKASEASGAPTS